MTEIVQTEIEASTDLMSLISPKATGLAPAQVESLVTAGDWLPRLQVMTGTANLIQSGRILPGKIALIWSEEKFRDLGDSVELLSLDLRAKALNLKGPNGNPIAFYDQQSADFQDVAAKSEVKDSGCVWGPEFLCWLPHQGLFVLFHCKNPTMRRSASGLVGLMSIMEGEKVVGFKPAPSLCKVRFIKKPPYSWHGADFHDLTTPLPYPADPAWFVEEQEKQLRKFKNPPKSQVEKVEQPAASAGGEARVR